MTDHLKRLSQQAKEWLAAVAILLLLLPLALYWIAVFAILTPCAVVGFLVRLLVVGFLAGFDFGEDANRYPLQLVDWIKSWARPE